VGGVSANLAGAAQVLFADEELLSRGFCCASIGFCRRSAKRSRSFCILAAAFVVTVAVVIGAHALQE
jgi:hypothetical protein